MTTTTTLRSWWSPVCQGPLTRVDLYGSGRVSVRASIVQAVAALDVCLRAWSYETRRADTGAYNCRRITGGTNYSLHAYGIAIDINWQSNPYGRRLVTDMPRDMVQAIKAIHTNSGRQVWRWGGDYAGNKDAMHFEIVCHPTDLATGIDPSTLPTAAQEDDEMTPAQMAEIKEHINQVTAFWGMAIDEKVHEHLDEIAERQVRRETAETAIRDMRRIGYHLEVPTLEGANPDAETD